jgi:S1-C subfamily serine protease
MFIPHRPAPAAERVKYSMDPSPDEVTPAPAPGWRQRWQAVRRRARGLVPFVAGALALLLALLVYNRLFPEPLPLTQAQVNDTVAQAMASATAPPPNASLVYQAILPSFVVIQTEEANPNSSDLRGLGSGVVVDATGSILTSLHVVEGAQQITVTFADGFSTPAILATAQPEKDIAVLVPQVLPDLLVPATLGNPNALRVGDDAYVVGNPLGLYASLSTGVISGFDRSFVPLNGSQQLDGLIQIDAAVNPGNSGGPLLNRFGQVVGIVTGLVNPLDQEAFAGIGFAVPIDVAGGAAGLPQY